MPTWPMITGVVIGGLILIGIVTVANNWKQKNEATASTDDAPEVEGDRATE